MKTKFFTGSGDAGESKIGGRNFSKADFLFEVLGGLDELNSWLGFCRAKANKAKADKKIATSLKEIQNSLFIIQAEIAAVGFGVKGNKVKISREKTDFLEKVIGNIDAKFSPLNNFVIPGGSELSARLDIARAFSRKVERQVVGFSRKKKASKEILRFLNRLSSCLFVLARYANYKIAAKEESPGY